MSNSKKTSKNNAADTPYTKGKRWGFAVAKSSLKMGKGGIYKIDKAMKTCSQNAKFGTRKISQNERDAYKGCADGMYEALRREEKIKKKLKPMRAKTDRYKVDTYVEDGIYNDRYTVHSNHRTLKEARSEAIKEEKYQKSLMDHSLYHIDSAISFNRKRYRTKK